MEIDAKMKRATHNNQINRTPQAALIIKSVCTQAMSLETKIEMIGNPSSEFFISDNELNDLLKDDVDWNAEYWDFQRLGLEQFTEKLSKLYAVSNGGFTFQAIWSGDKPSRIEYLSISEFFETVRSNKIGTKTKYVVAGGT